MKPFATALLCLALWPAAALATAQFPDRLRIDGTEQNLFAQPISQLFEQDPALEKRLARYKTRGCTAAWLGFLGTWEIRADRLYLVRLVANPCDDTPADIPLSRVVRSADSSFFSRLFAADNHDPVFADWFSGELRVPQGEQIEYIHMGFESRYERYLVIRIERGVVVERRVEQDDRIADGTRLSPSEQTDTR